MTKKQIIEIIPFGSQCAGIPSGRKSTVPFMMKYLKHDGSLIRRYRPFRNSYTVVSTAVIDDQTLHGALILLPHHASQAVLNVGRDMIDRYDNRQFQGLTGIRFDTIRHNSFRLLSCRRSPRYNIVEMAIPTDNDSQGETSSSQTK